MNKPDELLGYPFGFGGDALYEANWLVMNKFIDNNNVKSVLEVGSGFSTWLYANKGLRVTTFETSPEYAKAISEVCPDVTVMHYDYPRFPNMMGDYDMAFVDGPRMSPIYQGRLHSMYYAKAFAPLVFVHNCNRDGEKRAARIAFLDDGWTETYLGDQLSLFVSKGQTIKLEE